MRLNLEHSNTNAHHQLVPWVKNQILTLGRARRIDEANIRFARLENASPPYQVNIHLVTPGPDVFAESRDHTLRAALAKALSQLRDQIASRAGKRLQRLKSNLKARRCG